MDLLQALCLSHQVKLSSWSLVVVVNTALLSEEMVDIQVEDLELLVMLVEEEEVDLHVYFLLILLKEVYHCFVLDLEAAEVTDPEVLVVEKLAVKVTDLVVLVPLHLLVEVELMEPMVHNSKEVTETHVVHLSLIHI